MTLKESYKSCEKEILERVDPKTTSKFWAKVRNVSGIIAGITGGLLLLPIIPAVAIPYIQSLAVISAAVASRAHLDKSNILHKK